ncbi:DUF6114 domain-containing protein [Actinocorallia sp. A-T 12471]|uniref:DUF6114 domain-containing protein n=1 Tax=Actinocorallia sp. A-T 12471 TaxID=3089813 RepID=UPI0029D3EEF9|nr:DUF6114 domain-containing protein [Actinocorallia sp. A-T 12471]MDX6743774.1 DUF6114 domain-containing protein [Actinocorallia sp. A-T 12471]
MSASSAHASLAGFRHWRRTRPFWGGVFAVLAGVELIAIPYAPLAVSIHQGMPGVASWLAGAMLVAGGVLAWVHPVQRHFYGIITMLAALASFPSSNLGGFFLGLLLGVVGSGMIFAWSPGRDRSAETPGRDEIVPGLVS